MTTFEKELASLVNRHSMENGSNTPDFILANYLQACLDAFNKANIWRAKWFSEDGVPESERYIGPNPPFEMGNLTRKAGEVETSLPADPSFK